MSINMSITMHSILMTNMSMTVSNMSLISAYGTTFPVFVHGPCACSQKQG